MKNHIKVMPFLAVALVLAWGIAFQDTSEATVPIVNRLISENSSNNGQGGNGGSGAGKISADGKVVAFQSGASNLITGDTNSKTDIFIRNRADNITKRVSVSATGVEADNDSQLEAISQNGRYVAFMSKASNLIDNENNPTPTSYDVYLKDTKTNQITMINKNSAGTKIYHMRPLSISHDGRFVLAVTNSPQLTGDNLWTPKIVLFDKAASSWQFIAYSEGAAGPYIVPGNSMAKMSCDGAFIVYQSVDGKIYLVDRRTNTATVHLTQNANGSSFSPSISCDGRYIGFSTKSTNLVNGITPSDGAFHIVRYDVTEEEYTYLDLRSGTPTFLSRNAANWNDWNLRLTNQGNALFLLAPNGGYPYTTVYIRDVEDNNTEVLNRSYNGGTAYASVSLGLSSDANGKFGVYDTSDAANIINGDSNGYSDVFTSETGW